MLSSSIGTWKVFACRVAIVLTGMILHSLLAVYSTQLYPGVSSGAVGATGATGVSFILGADSDVTGTCSYLMSPRSGASEFAFWASFVMSSPIVVLVDFAFDFLVIISPTLAF